MKRVRSGCRFILPAVIFTLLLPVLSFAESRFGGSVKLGWFATEDPKAYGEIPWDTAEALGGDAVGLARPKGFVAATLSGGWFWENGVGFELSTRLPYYINVKLECFGFGCDSLEFEYERLIWPIFATLQYDFLKGSSVSPYIGIGAGGYFVSTSVSGAEEEVSDSKMVSGIHFVGGLRFYKRFLIEVKHESTSKAPLSSEFFDDGGNLGGTLINIGISF